MVGYFVKLVQSNNPRRIDEVVSCLGTRIGDVENNLLSAMPSNEEISEAIFQTNFAAGLWTVFPWCLIV